MTLPPRMRGLFEILGEVAHLVGHPDFYERLACVAAGMLDCKRWLVVRYARYALPEFIFNRAMSEEAIEFYFQRLYRLDPLLRLARTGPETGVVSLDRLRAADSDNAYFDDLFRSAWIFDEVSLLFAGPGRVCIALCFDRSDRLFTESEIEKMEILYPLLEGLHEAHLNSAFRALEEPSVWPREGLSPKRYQILDKSRRRVYATAAWMELEKQSARPLTEFVHYNRNRGIVSLSRDLVLHWERLDANFALAPEGLICMIENRRLPDMRLGFDDTVDSFAQECGLTPREQEIVALVFKGYPNALIAEKLGISSGTVRNHRHRLYYKLDITTERELFNMFISHLGAGGG